MVFSNLLHGITTKLALENDKKMTSDLVVLLYFPMFVIVQYFNISFWKTAGCRTDATAMYPALAPFRRRVMHMWFNFSLTFLSPAARNYELVLYVFELFNLVPYLLISRVILFLLI